jgi:predicted DNA binding CopG/RHH family protein
MRKRIKLTKQEKAIENALLRGEYVDASKEDFDKIAKALVLRRKDAVLNIRINSQDLANLKQKAKRLGVKYQSFISELLHRVAHS